MLSIAEVVPPAIWSQVIIGLVVVWCSCLAGVGGYIYFAYHLAVTRTPPWWASLLGPKVSEGILQLAPKLLDVVWEA